MNAPLFKFGLFGDETMLVVAFLLGIGFGFFLERAGFGSAKKLVAQFYLTDLAVFKVMFTGIVTAMLGLFFLGWLGVVDLALVYVPPTYLAPQIAGGLLLGVGFAVGGYCPGTSLVGVATGKLDAMIYALGIFAGVLVVGEAWPWISGFADSTAMGPLTLPGISGLSFGAVVFFVVLMALGGFVGAAALERRFAGKESST